MFEIYMENNLVKFLRFTLVGDSNEIVLFVLLSSGLQPTVVPWDAAALTESPVSFSLLKHF